MKPSRSQNAVSDPIVHPHPGRWGILAVLCLSLLVLGIDNLIVQVALPTLQGELSASATDLQWIVNAYVLTLAGLLGLSGGLVDRFGHRRALMSGYLVFVLASIAASQAGSADQLIAYRAVMGAGGSLIMPATLAVIRDVFDERERPQAIGIWAAMAALGIPLGPVLGGLLLEHYAWGSIFLVNVPIVAVALVLCWLLVPSTRSTSAPALDPLGLGLSVGALVALVWSVIEAPERGYTDPAVIAAFALSIVLAFAFWQAEKRAAEPLLPPALARTRSFSAPFLMITVFAFGLFGSVFVLTQYFQYVLGYDPLPAGLRLLGVATISISAPLGAVLTKRVGARRPVTAGLLIVAAGLGVAAAADASSEGLAIASLVVLGLGMGLIMAPCATLILASVPEGKGGVGSAAAETALQLGGALGVAVMGSVLSSGYGGEIDDVAGTLPAEAAAAVEDSIGGALGVAAQLGGAQAGRLAEAARDAFVTGQSLAMLAAAGVSLLGALLAAWLLPGRATSPGAQVPAAAAAAAAAQPAGARTAD